MKASLLARLTPAFVIAGTLSLGLAVPALAQTAARPGNETRATQQTGRAGTTEQNLVERRIADMHARLHITAAQQPQWQAFTEAMRQNARDMDQLYRERAEQLPHMNAEQDLESYARLEQVRAQDVGRLVQPFQQLYAALSPQQKREADNLFRAVAQRYQHRAQASTR